MLKRIISSLILIPLVMWIIASPGYFDIAILYLLSITISLLLTNEIIKMAPNGEKTYIAIVNYTVIFAFYILKYMIYKNIITFNLSLPLTALFCILILSSLKYIFIADFKNALSIITVSIFSFFYATVVLSYIIDIRVIGLADNPFLGAHYIFFILTASWLYDSGGYFFGRAFGKKKMGIVCSPNKSWAGFIGGLFLSSIGSLGFYYIYLYYFAPILSASLFFEKPWMIVLAALLLSIIAQYGDLIESIFKRSANIKDSGTIIAGHGGIFDAIDSIIPLLFFVNTYLILTQ